ncbi:hypothetical protein QQ045_027733 [Rhodiola kirilowii]
MGRKGHLFSVIKKVFRTREKKIHGSKNGKLIQSGASEVDIKCMDARDEGQTKHAYPGSTVIAASNANLSEGSGRSKEEELAAVKIQTAFRGYMSRRALRALKGLVRLRSLAQGPAVMRQMMNTVQRIQTLTHFQSQIVSRRRIRMLEKNQALQRQLILKQAEEEELEMGHKWDDSLKSKDETERKLMSKQMAAARRERALAYAFNHQTLRSCSSTISNPMFIPPGYNSEWGWSWMSAGQWDSQKNWSSTKLIRNSLSATARRSIGGSEDESMSIQYVKKHRRHSIAGCLSVKDAESLLRHSVL